MHWRPRLTQKILDNGWAVPDGLPRRSTGQVRVRCFKHAEVFEWATSAQNLLHAKGCRRCYHESLQTPLEEVKEAVRARGYAYQRHDIRNNRIHVAYTCGYLQPHTQSLKSILNTAIGCGCARTESRGERTVRSLAEKHTGALWPKVHKHELRRLTGEHDVPHELDMYCHSLRTAIEFDGIQHLGLGAFGKDHAKIAAKDVARDAFCARHGIRLIRISQAEFDLAWGSGLDEWFQDLLGVRGAP